MYIFFFLSNEDLTNGRAYDTFDDHHSQFEFDPAVTSKLKSIKKPGEKFYIKETIYEMEDIVDDKDDDGFITSEEIETKRYKCASPRRYHRSDRTPELDFDYDDCEVTPDIERTMPVDMPASNRHTRTYSNSSETDE